MSSHDKLAALAGEFLSHKRALGRAYDTPEFVLKRYLLFVSVMPMATLYHHESVRLTEIYCVLTKM